MNLMLIILMGLSSSLTAQCPLACNNLINVSLDESCIAEITADMMLEGQGVPEYCDYVVQVIGTNGQPLPPPTGYLGNSWVTSANIGQTLTVNIWLGNNRCWGTIKVEDKNAPVIECPDDLYLACFDEREIERPRAIDNCRTTPLPFLSNPNTPGAGIYVLSDITTDLGCDPEIRARRVIRYQARDASGNLSDICEHNIYYYAVSLNDVRFPKSLDGIQRPPLKCDGGWDWNQFKSNPNVPFPTSGLGWKTKLTPEGYPHPDMTGAPYIYDDLNISGYINGFRITGPVGNPSCEVGALVSPTNTTNLAMLGCTFEPYRIDTFYNPIKESNKICKLNVTYTDSKIDICPQSYKLLRNWIVLDWCSSTIKPGFQIIKILDDEGPSATIPPDVTTQIPPCVANVNQVGSDNITIANVSSVISAHPYTCKGEWLAIEPIAISDCSPSDKITYTVEFALDPFDGLYYFSKDGVVSQEVTVQGKKRWRLTGLPYGCTWIKYTLYDECGNKSEAFTEIRVVDYSPPIPVCDRFTVASLNNNGTAIIYAETFDDGSFDNCTNIGFEVARMTSGCGQSANVFGPFIEICCDDITRAASVDANGDGRIDQNDVGYIQVVLRVWDDANGDGLFNNQVVNGLRDNSNTCMVLVKIEDKIPPIIFCPPNVTLECNGDTSVANTGKPVLSDIPVAGGWYTDNCPNPSLSWSNSGTISTCGGAVITRTFRVTDRGALSSSCTQTITLRNSKPYTGPTSWPPNPPDIRGCRTADTHPDRTGRPVLGTTNCSQVAATWEDQTFDFVDDVCYKILRKWTVIDWCKFGPTNTFTSTNANLADASIGVTRLSTNTSVTPTEYTYRYPNVPFYGTLVNDPRTNAWTHTQIIKVIDTDKPEILITSKADTDAFGANCDGFVSLTNSAKDCTDSTDLVWTYEIDPFNDGIAPFLKGNKPDASGTYPVGTHKITWTVEDRCGNIETKSYTFKVVDRKKPTPYCITELTITLMPPQGGALDAMVEIWAKDFDKESTDNCLPNEGCKLLFTFDNLKPIESQIQNPHYFKWNPGRTATVASNKQEYESGLAQYWNPVECSSSLFLTCADVTTPGNPKNIAMTVWDVERRGNPLRNQPNNFDFCNVKLNIQANPGACPGSRVIGNIGREDDEMVQDVVVLLENTSNNESRVTTTNTAGTFDFASVNTSVNHIIKPGLNSNHANGVTTLDLVMIQRHILKIAELDSPYKLVAADATNDNRISANDISELRKLILGIYTELPNNSSWKFFDKSVKVTDPYNIWNVNQHILYDGTNTTTDFVAVKIGDVNYSAATNVSDKKIHTRSANPLRFSIEDTRFVNGEIVKVELKASNFRDLVGAQWTLNFDPKSLEFLSLEENALKITSDNYNATQSQSGRLAFSWNDVQGASFSSDEVLMTLVFRAITNNTITNTIKMSSDITKSEAYTQGFNDMDIVLDYRNKANAVFSMDQNNPNPFINNTSIGFYLPEAAEATITIFDVTGKQVKSITGQFAKGYNEVSINFEDVSATGVMLYELESNGAKLTKKMLRLDK